MHALVNRILFATDFSECAKQAEEYVLFFSARFHAPVEILHVLEFSRGLDPDYPVNQVYIDQLRREMDTQLAETVRRFQDKHILVNGRSILGVPSGQICAEATRTDTDLIVLGTRGKTGMEHLLLDSTSERVVNQAPCPVLTVRLVGSLAAETATAPRSVRVAHVLAAVDFSDCSLNALEYAVQVAKNLKATLTILHVLEPRTYGLDWTLIDTRVRKETRARLEAELETVVQAIEREGLEVHQAIRDGSPAKSLVEFITENRCDLIVMGTHGRHGLSHLINGSVAEAVLRGAPCPVVTVKSPKFAPGYRRIVSNVTTEDKPIVHRDA